MKTSRMPRLAWGSLYYNLFVIVWGAFVRATGSGAGCGSHWPLCNGQMVPRAPQLETIIEFTHRATSGICLLLAVAICWVGMRDYPKGNPVRRAAIAVLGFTLSEALVGAGLVLLGHVAENQSVGRVISITLHLVNTFALLASLALTAWWSSHPSEYRLETKASRPIKLGWVALASVALTVLLAMTGAITALGDTLFRASSLAQGWQQDFSEASHFLVRLRVIHPVLAVLTGACLFYFAELAADHRKDSERVGRLAVLQKAFVGLQLVVGLGNLVLLAPIGLQLAHLLVADCLWITLVLMTTSVLQAKGGADAAV